MAYGKGKGKAKSKAKTGYKKRAPMRRNNNVTDIRENYHRETLKGYIDDSTAAGATQCRVNMACGPAGVSGVGNFPNWAALAAKYDEYRVIYASVTTVIGTAEKPVFSLIERDGVEITTTDQMNKNPQRQLHIIDGDNKKVMRAWKPSTSSDYDFQPTSNVAAGNAKAHIKLLQDGLTAGVQKCQSALCIVCEFRGLNNSLN